VRVLSDSDEEKLSLKAVNDDLKTIDLTASLVTGSVVTESVITGSVVTRSVVIGSVITGSVVMKTTEDNNSEMIDISEIALDVEQINNESINKEPSLTKDSICREIIERIRNEEFGCNVNLSDEGKSLVAKHQERLGRSLERLSKDLYSRDTHFVLELIQNADDNNYPTEMFQ